MKITIDIPNKDLKPFIELLNRDSDYLSGIIADEEASKEDKRLLKIVDNIIKTLTK